MADKPTIPDFPTLPDFGLMITQACEVVANVRGIPYDFNGTLSLENKFVVLFKTVKEMFDAQDELVKSYKALHDFVNQYFTNLDVQNEVNKKIQSMAEDGSLLTLIAPTVSNKTSEWLRNNITNPTNPPIDKSLTVENAAADAKITGDEISTLKENIKNHSLRVNDGYYTIDNKPFNDTRDLNKISGSKCLMIDIGKNTETNKQNHTPPFTPQMLNDSSIMTLLNITPELTDDGTIQFAFLRGLNEEEPPYLYYRCRRKVDSSNFDKWSPWSLITDPRTCFTSTNTQYNNKFPPLYNDLNYYTDNKAYEFDIDFNNDQIANAPFYPFKGTLLCFNPNNRVLQQNEIAYPTVGTIQLVFLSRNVFNYKPEMYFRCCLSGKPQNEIWSEWTKLTSEIPLNFTPIKCIENFCVIGDSISAGYTNIGGTAILSVDAVKRKANWPSYMSLSISRPVENLSVGGASTQTWRDSLLNTLTTHECYIVYLGGNDIAKNIPIGSTTDIMADYNNNKNSYYGNYDYIVRYIHNHNPNAIIFCISNTFWDCSNSKYNDYNKAVKYIGNLYNYVSYIDITKLASADNKILAPNFNGHFSPVGYSIYGEYIQKAINDYIVNNPSKFLAIPYSLT